MIENRPQKRITIGLLVDWAEVEYQMKIIFGAIAAARAHGINLVCVEGGNIHSKREADRQRNMLYQYISEHDLDGLIMLGGAIGYFATQEQIRDFVRGFSPLPVVSIVREIDGCGWVAPDNSTGLRDLLVHLIEAHHRRRFAVITCAEDHPAAKVRFETVKSTLSDYGISLDDAAVVTGEFSWSLSSAREAVRVLLDDRKLKFDALVAANDNLAWGALEELRTRGIRVPEDVTVTGFDNFDFSAHSIPPLSSVSQSLNEQGYKAVQHLIGIISGQEAPRRIIVPTEMVIRESCGCHPKTADYALIQMGTPGRGGLREMLENREAFITGAIRSIESAQGKLLGIDLHRLVDRLIASVISADAENQEEFLETCFLIYRQTREKGNGILLWENIITELRRFVLSSLGDAGDARKVEERLHLARAVIADKALQMEKGSHQTVMNHNVVLNRISEELLSAFSINQMVEVLANRLPELGITAGFITRFEQSRNRRSPNARLILAYHKLGRVGLKEKDCATHHLVPKAVFDDGEPHCLLVTLLSFAKMKFGVMGIELDLQNAYIYGALRRIVCSSLHSVILNNRIKEREKRLVAREYAKNLEQMKKAMEGIINTILLTMETRDPYTAGHQNRVADLATAIAQEMKLPQETVEGIRMAGIVHDVGKISVPTEILNKPGKLRKPEFELIKEHCQVAYDILKNLEFPWPISETILQHHERMNGSGYPHGLKGDAIKPEARILAVADVIEAMASHRPYRPALGIGEALQEIRDHRGDYYDPEVVDSCLRLFTEKGYKLPELL